MCLVSRCLTSTPVEDLPVVSGIIPPDIRRDHLVLSLANKATEKNHMLHSTVIQHPNRRLRLKSGSSSFHLNNPHARDTINVMCNGDSIPYDTHPKYLGVILDRTLSYSAHIQSTAAKVRARNNLLRRLAGSNWGPTSKTLRISALALAYAPAEYCAPVWCSSSHTPNIDLTLNNCMRLVSGRLTSTPVEGLPVVSGITAPDIRRDHLVLNLANKATEKNHMLHSTINQHPNRRLRLKYRKPLWIHIRNLRSTDNSDSYNWSQRQWAGRWQSAKTNI